MKRFGLFLPAVFLGLFSSAALAQSNAIASYDFESGAQGWTLNNYCCGFWRHASATSCAGWSTGRIAYNSPTTCDYNNGGGSSGDTISPVIDLSVQVPPYSVTLKYRRQTGTGESISFKARKVGQGWILLNDFWVNDGSIQTLTLPIIGLNGQIELGVFFSADPFFNKTIGFEYDDLEVSGSGPAIPPPPTVAGVSPQYGPTTGMNNVVIQGANFTQATAVRFGANPAPSFTVVSDNQIVADAGPNGIDLVDVAVDNPGGTGTLPDSFHYYETPTSFGFDCSTYDLQYVDGAASIGQTVNFFTANLNGASQILLVKGLGSTLARKMVLMMPFGCSQSCGFFFGPDLYIGNGTNPNYALAIPNSTSMIGKRLDIQSMIVLGGCPSWATTKAWDIEVGP